VQSRLGTSQGVHFESSQVAELTDILWARADRGLAPGAAGQADLVTIADGARGDARAEIRQQTRSKLTRHQRVLLEVIEAAGEIAAGELHERYEDAV
jgi:Cdc6-like AAA superfamily ATPase